MRACKEKRKKMRFAVRTTALLSLSASVVIMPAIAEDDEGELAPVVITGSNIPTVELEGPSPVVTIDQEKINRSGAETVGELLRRLPQNNAGSFDEKFQNSFAPGSSGVSLRGMGMGYTLVLVDGRRLGKNSTAQNMTTSFADLGSIPLAVVERVEILLDGASAIYGSEAIAGVVNIITRDNFDGLEIKAHYSNTTNNDMGTQAYSITGGTMGERGNAWISFDYLKRNSMKMDDRDFSATADQSSLGGFDFRSSAGNPGSIKLLPDSDYFESMFKFYKIPNNITGTPTDMEIIASPGMNHYNQNKWKTLYPEFERYGAAGKVNYSLTDYATAFVHTTYRNMRTQQSMAPTPAFGDLNADTWGTLPASNAFNPFAEDITFRHRLTEVGPRLNDIEKDVFRILPGLKFNFGDTWYAETAFLYFNDDQVNFGRNYVSTDAFKEALASDKTATAYNIFGSRLGTNSPDVLDSIRANTYRHSQSELQLFDVKAGGDLTELPGGPLALAVGAETAKEQVSDLADSLSMTKKIVALGGTSNSGRRNRDAAYAEFSIPVIGEENRISGIHSLGLQAAWRFEKYSDFGSADNPKVGIKYAPWERLLLRSTYQTAFAAPSLQHLYMGQSESYPTLIDPARGDVGMQYKVKSEGNPDLNPEESDSISVGAVLDIPMPENMEMSFTVNWSQIELEDQVTSVGSQFMLSNEDLYNDRIMRNSQTDADKTADNPGRDGLFGTLKNPEWGQDDIPNGGIPGSIKYINDSFLNLAEVKIEALDFSINYRINTSIGKFSSSLDLAYIYQYDFQSRPTSPYNDQAGSYNYPEWRGNSSIWWSYDKYGFGATVNYVDSFNQRWGAVSEVDSHTTLDLQATYNIRDNAKLTLGSRNITNENPPWSDSESEGYSYSTAGHNPFGSILYGNITLLF
tara:strand:- start:1001 stop:3742 length:2742 start_codon:yes stop_codon:yes gene_type:complete